LNAARKLLALQANYELLRARKSVTFLFDTVAEADQAEFILRNALELGLPVQIRNSQISKETTP